MSLTIEIGKQHYLLYLLLPHAMKMRLLSADSRRKLDDINRMFTTAFFSGVAAVNYNQLHRYDEAKQHDFPLRELIDDRWVRTGYGRAIEIGAGSGYATALIARRARSVTAVEVVPDMQAVIRERCRREGFENVEVVGCALRPGRPLGCVRHRVRHPEPASPPPAPEVFHLLHRILRPGGRALLLEPYHNVRRVLQLLHHWRREYRAPAFWKNELNSATHDFVTWREIQWLCRQAGFREARICGHWMPGFRRLPWPLPAVSS